MYYDNEELTREQIEAYNRDKLHGLWNPGAIDRDTNLTESQKEQMKNYNQI